MQPDYLNANIQVLPRSWFDQARQSTVIAAPSAMQTFPSGATRSADEGKIDFEGFMSFPALEAFGNYMTRHRTQADGSLRESDNWQKGMPLTSYLKSLVRHTLELWGLTRGIVSQRIQREYPLRDMRFLKLEVACACWFNLQGFIHEFLKEPVACLNQTASQPMSPGLLGGLLGATTAPWPRYASAALPRSQKQLSQLKSVE